MKSYSQRFHTKLASYFDKSPLYLNQNENKTNNRKLIELPWQQTKAKLNEKITATLLNIEFIQAKLVANMSYELLSDYKLANINTTEIGWMQSFLLTNLSNLQRYPNQLFNLIYFHGNSEIKQKTKETYFNKNTDNSLFLSEKVEVKDFGTNNTNKAYRYSVISKTQLYSSNILTILKKKELLFYMENIGKLSCLRISDGQRIPITIKLSATIPEKIQVSENGKYLIVANSSQEAIIYKLDYQVISGNLQIVCSKGNPFSFLLPDFDSPIFHFSDNQIIYQDDNSDLVQMSLLSFDKTILVKATNFEGTPELATLSLYKNQYVAGFRFNDYSILVFFKDNQPHKLYKVDNIIQCSAFIESNEIVFFTLDKKLHHIRFENDKVIEIRHLQLEEEPSMCCGNSGRVVVHLLPNKLFVYERDGNLTPIIGLPNKMGILSQIVSLNLNSFALVSPIYLSKFSIDNKVDSQDFEVISLLQNSKGDHLLYLKNEDEHSIFDFESKVNHKLDLRSKGFISSNFVAIDGEDNILHIWFEGGAEFFIAKQNKWIQIEKMPLYPISVIGDEKYGFWISTQNGEIFRFDSNGEWYLAYRIDKELKGSASLKQFGDILVWNGIVLVSSQYGTDFKCEIAFFQITNSTNLKRINTRIFSSHNGLVDSICFNDNTNTFYIFLTSDKNKVQYVRVGKLADFLNETEEKEPIHGLDQSVRDCVKISNKNRCLIIGNENGLFELDLDNIKVTGVLMPNAGFSNITQNPQYKKNSILINSSSEIYNLQLNT